MKFLFLPAFLCFAFLPHSQILFEHVATPKDFSSGGGRRSFFRDITIYIFLTIFLSLNGYVHAQWESMHGPFGSYINDLSQNEQYILAATPSGIFRSSDTGLSWEHKPFVPGARYPCLQFDVIGSLIVADAIEIRPDTLIRRMYKSVDHGDNWIEIPRPAVPVWVQVGIVDSVIFANDGNNIWITRNDGQYWSKSLINHLVQYPNSFARFGSGLFVGDSAYLYIYEGNDATWLKRKIPIAESCDFIFAEDSLVLVRDRHKNNLFVSTDYGKSWFNSPGSQWGGFDNYFAKIGQTLFATGYEIMYTSIDNGLSWTTIASKGLDDPIALIARDSILIAGYEYAGIYRSSDLGEHFHFSSEGMDAAYVENIFMIGDQLLTGGNIQGVFNYDLKERVWKKTYFDENARDGIFDLEVFGGKLFASNWHGVQRFDSASELWIEDSPYGYDIFPDLILSPYGLIAGGNNYGLPGQPWFYNFGYWSPFVIQIDGNEVFPYLFAQNAQYRFAGKSKRIARWHSTVSGWYWLPDREESGSILDLITIDEDIFIIQARTLLEQTDLYVSHENGLTWERADSGIPKGEIAGVRKLIGIGDYLLCSTYGYKSGIYYSRKDPIQWHSFNDGLPFLDVKDISTDGQYMYAAVSGQGLWRRRVDELFLTEIEKPEEIISLRVYPNPANDRIYLQLPSGEATTAYVKIFDLHGSMVLEKQIDDIIFEIGISTLVAGVYFLQVETEVALYLSKVVVQR